MTIATRILPALLAGLLLPFIAQGKLVESSGAQANLHWQMTPGNSAQSQAFLTALQRGLNFSGAFRPGNAGNHDYRIEGDANSSGGQLSVNTRVLTAGGQNVYNASKRGSANDATHLGLVLADEIVLKLTGTPGIASSQLIAVSNKTGRKELYLLTVGGSQAQQITTDNNIVMEPKWGPQGRYVTYTSFHMRFPDAYKIDVQSGSRVKISGEPGVNSGSVISPDGRDTAIILSKEGNTQLYIKSGGSTRRITSDATVKATPTWSPDGRQLAYCGNNQIWVVNRNGTGARTISSGRENVEPNWSKNGKLVYSSKNGGRYVLVVQDPRGGSRKELRIDGADWTEPSWAPNGRHLVATRTSGYQSSIYVVDTLNPKNTIHVTEGRPGDWAAASWSPKK